MSEAPGLRKPKNLNVNTCGSDDEVCDDGCCMCDSPEDKEESADAFGLYRTGIECSTDTKDTKTIKPYVVIIQVGRGNLAMEIDTQNET